MAHDADDAVLEPVDVTVVADAERTAPGWRWGSRLLVAADRLAPLADWTLKPEGLCRGASCVPVRDREALVAPIPGPDGEPLVDLEGLAAALGRPCALEVGDVGEAGDREPAAVLVMVAAAAELGHQLAALDAPDVTLPDLDGRPVSLHDFTGQKRMLLAFSSWCGCRYDLPGWQAQQERLAGSGFTIIAVALDEDPEAVRPFAEAAGATFPVLVDREHLVAERYGMVNVPTVVWIDEDDHIVRPPDYQFSDDQFVAFNDRPSGPHLAELEHWVTTGEPPYRDPGEVLGRQRPPTDDEQLARAERRLAVHLLRLGRPDVARQHFDRAGALAPLDFTVRRSALPLQGKDPFLGEEFLELFEEWTEAGRPTYPGGGAPVAPA